MRKRGDLSEGLAVKRRMVELGTAAELAGRVVDELEGNLNG